MVPQLGEPLLLAGGAGLAGGALLLAVGARDAMDDDDDALSAAALLGGLLCWSAGLLLAWGGSRAWPRGVRLSSVWLAHMLLVLGVGAAVGWRRVLHPEAILFWPTVVMLSFVNAA